MSLRTAQVITVIVMVGSVAVWIAWDIIVAAMGFSEATESVILLAAGAAHFSGPAAVGFVLGHISWPAPKVDHKALRLWISGAYFLGLFIANLQNILPEVMPVIPLLLHIPAGRLGWPQSEKIIKD